MGNDQQEILYNEKIGNREKFTDGNACCLRGFSWMSLFTQQANGSYSGEIGYACGRSRIASKIADNRMVFYKDINDIFLTKDGTLIKDVMSDFLHPNAKGYELEAAAIEPTIVKLLGEK